MPQIELTVNGTARTIDVEPSTPLLWVLRDALGLTGTKFGCGMAYCGACTVHLDGQPVRSCVIPVSAVADRRVITIEGIFTEPIGVALRRAWVEEDVPQCGYCQPGQIMTAAGLLQRNPNPTDRDIDESMSANLCRCGTYQRIRRAIHRAGTRLTSSDP